MNKSEIIFIIFSKEIEMKILIDTGSFSPSEDNIIVFKGGRWQIISRQHYLAYQDKIILEQCKTIDRLEKAISYLG